MLRVVQRAIVPAVSLEEVIASWRRICVKLGEPTRNRRVQLDGRQVPAEVVS